MPDIPVAAPDVPFFARADMADAYWA